MQLRPPQGTPVYCPSGTRLLESIASSCGSSGIGVVLTGIGSDGAEGLLAMRKAGGVTFAQDEASSVVYGMPKAAQELGAAEHQLSPDRIAVALNETLLEPSKETR